MIGRRTGNKSFREMGRTMEFGQRLRDLRKQKNLSQRDLAARVGIDFTYLSKIEGGRLDPPSEIVIRHIAQVLDADEDELINLAGKVPKDLKAVLEESPQAVELLRSHWREQFRIRMDGQTRFSHGCLRRWLWLTLGVRARRPEPLGEHPGRRFSIRRRLVSARDQASWGPHLL